MTLDDLVDGLARASLDTIVADTAEFLARGASPSQLLAAAFLAPILTGGDGEDLHALLVVPSIDEHFVATPSLRSRSPVSRRLLPVFWAVWNAKLWTKRERVDARDSTPLVAEPDEALADAFAEGDEDHAAAAAASLVRARGVEVAAARLGVEASHRRGDPHVAIYAAQAARSLTRLCPSHGEVVLASVARRVARAKRREHGIVAPIRVDESDATPPEAIASQLAASSEPGLEGVRADAIWQALALFSIDTRLDDGKTNNDGGGRALHQTTLLDALWFVYDRASPLDRPYVLADAVERTLEVRSAARQERSEALAGPLSRLRADSDGFLEDLRDEVAAKATGEHDFKFFGAAEAIAGRLAGDLRERWWAAASLADPIGTKNRWHLADEASARLEALQGPRADR